MRLKNYLTEEVEEKYIKLFELLKKNCSEIIKEYKEASAILYRGSEKTVNDFLEVVPRNDRKPLSTDPRLHAFYDELFYKKFGWRPRSSGVFATFDKETSHSYGKDYYFFPFDGYKYIWSKRIEDLFFSRYFNDVVEKIEKNSKYTKKYVAEYGPDSGNGKWNIHLDNYEDAYGLKNYSTLTKSQFRDTFPSDIFQLKNNPYDFGSDKIDSYDIYYNEENKKIGHVSWATKKYFGEWIKDNLPLFEKEFNDVLIDEFIDNNLEDIEKQEVVFKCSKYYIVSPIEYDYYKLMKFIHGVYQ